MACPLRSADITPLPRYYGAVRPCPACRYFRPHGAAACAFSLTTAEQVLKFPTRAKIRVTPPAPPTPHGQQPGFPHAFPGERGCACFDAAVDLSRGLISGSLAFVSLTHTRRT